MKKFESVDELLDFAISEEEAAARFYKRLAGKMDRPAMREVFEEFSREEEGHKAKLLKIKAGKVPAPPREQVQDLKIADYLVDVEPRDDMDYQHALILAMKKEKAAFRLYSDLASLAGDDKDVRDLFLSLAHEEAKHKLRFEVEYDEEILREN
jgi:rubrerythrin